MDHGKQSRRWQKRITQYFKHFFKIWKCNWEKKARSDSGRTYDY